jgi:hypothetical protein
VDANRVVKIAGEHLASLSGHSFDVLTLAKPVSPDAALNLAKIISKLSPLLGNLIEFNAVEFLNDKEEFKGLGHWKRQDPDFPDAVLEGKLRPTPGMEIKAWFPLATEITARFRESQNHFTDGRTMTDICMLAWLPEHLIYGRPYLLDVVVVNGLSVARARDNHYHNPPDYLVLEPEDTKERTRNLQQTNTNGYKFQGTAAQFHKALKIVEGWGAGGKKYKPTHDYQQQIRELTSKFKYRLDTNYAKMDRIAHPGIEEFKTRVCGTKVNGMTVAAWTNLFASIKPKKTSKRQSRERLAKMAARLGENEVLVKTALAEHLEIAEEDTGKLLA